MVNYNPETVSTDYDECERLYFDEISFEVSHFFQIYLERLFSLIIKCTVNACVANGGWVPKDLGTGTNNPNPGRWNTPQACPTCNPATSPARHAERTSGLDNPNQWGLMATQPQPPKGPDLRHPTPAKSDVNALPAKPTDWTPGSECQ